MQSRSKKAAQVREFYYELEQVVDRYKDYIIQGLKDKIALLENNQKPKINPKSGLIYVLETNMLGHIKLGKTKNLVNRLRTYNSKSADDIVPIYVYETDDIDEVERCVKSYAKKHQYRKHKEIYKININTLKELIHDCGKFNESTRLKLKHKKRQSGGDNIKHFILFDKSK